MLQRKSGDGDHPVQGASISKTLNAAVILKKVMEGKLSLDGNVNTYLRSWKLPDNEFTAKKKVTIANLLSHTGAQRSVDSRVTTSLLHCQACSKSQR